MENVENTGVQTDLGSEQPIDTALAQENTEAQDGEGLSSLLETAPTEPTPAAENGDNQTGAMPDKEPGWIKGRINKAVQKAVEEAERRVAERYESMLAPIREQMLEREAQALVDSGEVGNLEVAKELLRLRQGQPAPVEPAPVQRDEKGRFTKGEEETDPAIQIRSDMLAKQADKIRNKNGLDVMEAFRSDEEIQQRVLSGEWDFYDVAEALQSEGSRKHVPAPIRTPNANQVGVSAIASMSDEQFEQLQRNLAAGRRYDVRR